MQSFGHERCCILSKFYIKPQPALSISLNYAVVSYRNSTSNHNPVITLDDLAVLYLIEILHQTTTRPQLLRLQSGCILSKFYIKPQLRRFNERLRHVVSYRNSTSNHNNVLYNAIRSAVVSYRNSTSNHNSRTPLNTFPVLYLIEILHQTTTPPFLSLLLLRCILSKFYIKPQRCSCTTLKCEVVSYRNSTSNHNEMDCCFMRSMVVSYRNSTSNHNRSGYYEPSRPVVSYRNSTSNHNLQT